MTLTLPVQPKHDTEYLTQSADSTYRPKSLNQIQSLSKQSSQALIEKILVSLEVSNKKQILPKIKETKTALRAIYGFQKFVTKMQDLVIQTNPQSRHSKLNLKQIWK